jgi:hypothetical protein
LKAVPSGSTCCAYQTPACAPVRGRRCANGSLRSCATRRLPSSRARRWRACARSSVQTANASSLPLTTCQAKARTRRWRTGCSARC